MKIDQIVIDKLSEMLANTAANIFIETSKKWRFFFPDEQKKIITEKFKLFIMELLKNAK